MNAEQLFRAGNLDEAIALLSGEVRKNPTDTQRRTFLFELLCFTGDHARAEKQLEVLAGGGRSAEMGSLLYQTALHADRTRQEMFLTGGYPRAPSPPSPASGTFNGRPFQSIQDADPRIGARLELFAAGQYMWIPFQHIATIRMAPPTRLRDLLWAPAVVRTGAGFRGLELGEVLLPVLTPLAWQHPNQAVRLGRVTEWVELEDSNQVPIGQKLLVVDGEESPFLELRELDVSPAAASVC